MTPEISTSSPTFSARIFFSVKGKVNLVINSNSFSFGSGNDARQKIFLNVQRCSCRQFIQQPQHFRFGNLPVPLRTQNQTNRSVRLNPAACATILAAASSLKR